MTTMIDPGYASTHAPRRPENLAAGYSIPALRPVSSVRPVFTVRPVPPVRSLSLAPTTQRARAIFTLRNITIVLVAFAAIFVGRLFISVVTDANAYSIAAKAKQSQNLTRDAQFIQEQLDVMNSPQHLSTAAQKLGMISNSRPAYLRISDGRVWGNPLVVSPLAVDNVTIANALETTIMTSDSHSGVASLEKTASGGESGKRVSVVVPTSGIPAPNTH